MKLLRRMPNLFLAPETRAAIEIEEATYHSINPCRLEVNYHRTSTHPLLASDIEIESVVLGHKAIFMNGVMSVVVSPGGAVDVTYPSLEALREMIAAYDNDSFEKPNPIDE